jgi:hypothetical protein
VAYHFIQPAHQFISHTFVGFRVCLNFRLRGRHVLLLITKNVHNLQPKPLPKLPTMPISTFTARNASPKTIHSKTKRVLSVQRKPTKLMRNWALKALNSICGGLSTKAQGGSVTRRPCSDFQGALPVQQGRCTW